MNNQVHANAAACKTHFWRGTRGTHWLKYLLTMKLTVLLVLFFSFHTMADAFAQKVDLEAEDQPLKTVLQELSKQTGYAFIYRDRYLGLAELVTVTVKDKTLKDALVLIFAGQPFDYKIRGKIITLIPKIPSQRSSSSSKAYQISIYGTVTDTTENPLSGVSVTVKDNPSLGVATGPDGSYRLEAPEDAVLVFSYLGFETLEVSVSGRAAIDVVLRVEEAMLDELVVVGYGTQKKVSMISAVSSISSEELERRPARNVSAALQGAAPGLTVWDLGGEPGTANQQLRIRGVTTLGNSAPLVIVDGVEQDFNNVNPSDIASVSVLKDAASTAIYGSRAANGVVLITTKRGKEGQLNVSYHGWLELQNPTNVPEHMDVASYLELQNIAYANRGDDPPYSEEEIQHYISGDDRLHYPLPNTWFETAIQKNAPMHNHSLSISGGGEKIKTLASLNYFDQKGIFPNRNAQRYQIRLNNDIAIARDLSLNADLNIRRNNRYDVNGEQGYQQMTHGSQWAVPRFPDGTYGLSKQGHNALMYSDPAIMGSTETTVDNTVINLKGTWDIIEGLDFSSQYAFDMVSFTATSNFPRYGIRDYWDKSIIHKSQDINRLAGRKNSSLQKTWNNTLNYHHLFEQHDVNILLGYSEESFRVDSLSAEGRDYYNNDLRGLGQGDPASEEVNSSMVDWGLRSVFGRINYSFDDRYLLELNARYDGSSRFPKGRRYTFFPSMAGAWRVSEEAFWEPLRDKIGQFKIRASWGETGNQNVQPYSYLSNLDVGSYYLFGGVPVTGVLQTVSASQDLTWELTRQTNIGLDLSLFNNKLEFTFDWFDKLTEGILLNLPVPGVMGLEPAPINAGSVKNTGWDVQLLHRNRIGEWSYHVKLNFSDVKNEIVDLAGTGPYYSGEKDWLIRQEGQPIDALWGFRTDGFYTQEDIDNGYPLQSADSQPGDFKYVDMNDDGEITSNDRVILSSTIPRLTYSMDLGLNWRNFDFNLQLQGVAKQDVALMGAFAENGSWEGFALAIGTDYWSPDNTDARFARPQKQTGKNTLPSDRWVLNGAYMRMKNLQLGYTLPADFTQYAGIGRARLYIGGTNLFSFSELNDWGVDPEVPAGRALYYPPVKTYTFGLDVDF